MTEALASVRPQGERETQGGERSAPPALAAERLAARYGGQAALALADVSLTLGAGERLLLLGPNGAGKSTLVRVFAGLMPLTAGEACVFGAPARQARHLVGVVAHTTYLYEELSAAENLRLYGDLYGVAELAERTREVLAAVGLAHLADERVGRLSRGQQQRVSLARAVLHDPPLLLLDEPETGLDVAAFDLLERLAEGRAVLLTTHNLAAGLRLCSQVAVLARGQVAYRQASATGADAGPLAELLRDLATGQPRAPGS